MRVLRGQRSGFVTPSVCQTPAFHHRRSRRPALALADRLGDLRLDVEPMRRDPDGVAAGHPVMKARVAPGRQRASIPQFALPPIMVPGTRIRGFCHRQRRNVHRQAVNTRGVTLKPSIHFGGWLVSPPPL